MAKREISKVLETRVSEQSFFRAFLYSFLVVAIGLALIVFAVGRTVDPFLHFDSEYKHFPWGNAGRSYPSYTLNRSLFKTVQFHHYIALNDLEPKSLNVLVGDSVANQLDPVLLAEYTEEPWFNMAYGQATLEENIALVDHLLDLPEVTRIVWGLPITRLRSSTKNEMPRSLRLAAQPLQHLFTVESLRGVYFEHRYRLLDLRLQDPPQPGTVADQVRNGIFRFQVDVIERGFPNHLARMIDDLVRLGNERDIEIVCVEWPLHPDMREILLDRWRPYYDQYREFLENHCQVRIFDMPGSDDDRHMYRDAVHLLPEYKIALAQELASALIMSSPGGSGIDCGDRYHHGQS